MVRILSICVFALCSLPVLAFADWTVDSQQSMIAVITHKGGLAKGLAHNHLVAADTYQSSLSMTAGDPASLSFTLSFKTTALSVDDPERNKAWSKRIMELGILDEELSQPSDKDRGKIRKAMLGKKQLNADKFPEIKAELTGVSEKAMRYGNQDFPLAVEMRFTIHGKSVTKTLAARIVEGDELQLEVVGGATFSEFGMKPYSALLGAVSNQDGFHFYANVKANAQ